jgi:YD repeat-containing protein
VAELGGRNVAYGYDADYLLTSEAITGDPHNNGTIGYNYDVVGNRKQLTSSLSSIGNASYSYDVNDRLTTDGYDANGNTTSSLGVTNTYDFENRMTAHGTTTMVYNGDGNRVSETVGGEGTVRLLHRRN